MVWIGDHLSKYANVNYRPWYLNKYWFLNYHLETAGQGGKTGALDIVVER